MRLVRNLVDAIKLREPVEDGVHGVQHGDNLHR